MSTTGVKRVGKGYQSDAKPILSNTMPPKAPTMRRGSFFHSSRKPMPPPVSSDDAGMRPRPSGADVEIDEFGVVQTPGYTPNAPFQDSTNNTVGTVRRALKAIVTGKR